MTQPKEKQQVAMHEVMDDFDRFEYFFESRWRMLIYLCVAAVIMVGVATWSINAYRSRQTRAAAALTAAETPEQIRAALAAHGRHPAAGHARLRLASLLLDDGQAEAALGEIRTLLATSPAAPEVAWQARLNEAYIIEALGRDEESAESFAALGLDITFPEFVRDEANVNAARIFLSLAKPDRARACLQAINVGKSYMDAGAFWSEQAKELVKRLP